MRRFLCVLTACLPFVLGACTEPWKNTVPITDDGSLQLTLGGVDHINPVSIDTTGAALFLSRKDPNGNVETEVIGQPSIVHQRGLIGVAVEQAAGPALGGWFYWKGQAARPPDQINVQANGGSGGVGGIGGSSNAITGTINANAMGGNANAQQQQGQGQGQGQSSTPSGLSSF
jgi:hypothetical protein